MSNFASGKKAIAYCDRCSFEYPYNDLRFEIFNQKRTGYTKPKTGQRINRKP